jgi:hypothetical protein
MALRLASGRGNCIGQSNNNLTIQGAPSLRLGNHAARAERPSFRPIGIEAGTGASLAVGVPEAPDGSSPWISPRRGFSHDGSLNAKVLAMSPNVFWPIVWISLIAGVFLLKGCIFGFPS